MPAGPYAEFSFLTLLVLLGVLGLSCLTFWLLVRRATSHRTWVALSDWGRNRGFRYHPIGGAGAGDAGRDGPGREPPAPFSTLPAARPSVRLWLASPDTQLLELQPPGAAAAAAGPAAPADFHGNGGRDRDGHGERDPGRDGDRQADGNRDADRHREGDGDRPGDVLPPPRTWHALVKQVESNWPPTALRPAAHDESLLDLFSLASFPSMIASERFVIFGTDSAAARVVAKSSLPALLPPDVGLLLHGRVLVLDFSARPFDTIEFDRMLALANHLTSHLPAVKR